MKKLNLLFMLSIFLLLNFSCKKKITDPAPPQEMPLTPTNTNGWDNKPFFGFNNAYAKGNITSTELSYITNYFDSISDWIKPNLIIRVTGGGVSQKTYNQDWTDAAIEGWVNFQQTEGVRFIYVVNGNDTPENQKEVIKRWIDKGAHFDFIEMMNEYFMKRYMEGDTTAIGVTYKVTAENYADSLLPLFWAQLDTFNLPYYICFANAKPPSSPKYSYYTHWNNVMIDSVMDKYPTRDINATLHLYTSGTDSSFYVYDYNQITDLRNRLPIGRHIAITEAGVTNNAYTSQEVGDASILHYKKILAQLKKGDYLIDQAIFNGNTNWVSNRMDVSAFDGTATAKGQIIRQFVNDTLN